MKNQRPHLRNTHLTTIAFGALAFAAVPTDAHADSDGDDNAAACTVSYYLTAPYDKDSNNYDHVVVFEDDCETTVSCDLESGDRRQTILLEGPGEYRIKLSTNNERPSFDATATCSALR